MVFGWLVRENGLYLVWLILLVVRCRLISVLFLVLLVLDWLSFMY